MEDIEIKFSERLKVLRGSSSQQDIANAIGATVGAYKMWETGKREPNLTTLVRMARKFNVSLDYLIGTTENAVINKSSQNDSDYNLEIKRILSGISEIALDNSEDEEIKLCITDFSDVLNIADASRLSKNDFISRVTGSTIDSKNGIDMHKTKKQVDMKLIDFSRIYSREKAIRDKMNTLSETLQKRFRNRAEITFNILVGYVLTENEKNS